MRSRSTRKLGPVPYWLYALVLLLDLLVLVAALAAFTQLVDWVEDMIWPGGPEWID